ncbi:MAG: TMEM175 family protein [Gammaproteobacteria bacterium]
MNTNRLEAFSDGVIAIIITIMVLGLSETVGKGAGWGALKPVVPVFLSYVLSFVYVGIYWNNHHHMLHATGRVNGRVLWANLHLLFWLSLFPFVTAWAGENRFMPVPTVLYGAVLLMAATAYWILQVSIIAFNGRDSILAQAVGRDFKGKLSMVAYALGIGLAFVNSWASNAIYLLMALVWLVPDRRIESRIA